MFFQHFLRVTWGFSLAVLALEAETESFLGEQKEPRASELSLGASELSHPKDKEAGRFIHKLPLRGAAAPGTLVFLRVRVTGALRRGAQVFAGRPVRGMWGTCPSSCGGWGGRDGGETEARGRGERRTDQETDPRGRSAPSPSSRNSASESQLRLCLWSLSPAVPTSLVTRPPGQGPASWGLWAEEVAGRLDPSPCGPLPSHWCPRSSAQLSVLQDSGEAGAGGARCLEGAADSGSRLVSAVKSSYSLPRGRGEVSRPEGSGPRPGPRPRTHLVPVLHLQGDVGGGRLLTLLPIDQ